MVAAGLSPTLQRREEPLEETSCLSDVPVLREALLPVLLGWWGGAPWCFRGAGRRLAGGEHKQPWRHCHSRRANSLAQLLINNQRLKASIHLNSLIGNGQQYKKESE